MYRDRYRNQANQAPASILWKVKHFHNLLPSFTIIILNIGLFLQRFSKPR